MNPLWRMKLPPLYSEKICLINRYRNTTKMNNLNRLMKRKRCRRYKKMTLIWVMKKMMMTLLILLMRKSWIKRLTYQMTWINLLSHSSLLLIKYLLIISLLKYSWDNKYSILIFIREDLLNTKSHLMIYMEVLLRVTGQKKKTSCYLKQ